MKIYHTETQADYDALLIHLKELGYKYIYGSEFSEERPYVIVWWTDMVMRSYQDLMEDEEFKSLPITKYKAKVNEMKFTKENVEAVINEYFRQAEFESCGDLIAEIDALDDTPEKVVVPKCFDEWFKEIVAEYPITDSSKRFALWKLSKQGFEWGFERANGEKIPYDTDLGKWLFKNRELAINAILNGYTIERERFYCIPLPHLETADGTKQYLTKSGAGNYLALSPCIGQKQRYTKEELEQVPEIYRPFAKLIEEEE